MRDVPLPEIQYNIKDHSLAKEELSDEGGQKIMLSNMFEVRYVLYSQANDARVVHIPEQMVEGKRTVNEYIKYLRDLRHISL